MISRLQPRTRSRAGPLLLLAVAIMAALPGCAQTGGEDTPTGRLASLGADGNVYVTTPGAAEPLQITHDATVPAEGEGLPYHRLAWSPGGALAFAAVEHSGSRARGRLYVLDDVDDAAGPLTRGHNPSPLPSHAPSALIQHAADCQLAGRIQSAKV